MTGVRKISELCKNRIPTGAMLMGLGFGAFLFFQSCTPTNDVQPLQAAPANIITVKVRENSQGSTENLPTKHLTILAAGAVVFDKDITGNFSYNFTSSKSDVKVTATLTSNTAFINSLEIDANNQMHAYHNGSCTVKEFDITDELSF